jgi:hypothetical protein
MHAYKAIAEADTGVSWECYFLELPLGKFWFELSITPMEQ